MWAATPTLTAFVGSSCGPLVKAPHSGREQRSPVRKARARRVCSEKSHLKMRMRIADSVVQPPGWRFVSTPLEALTDFRDVILKWRTNTQLFVVQLCECQHFGEDRLVRALFAATSMTSGFGALPGYVSSRGM